MKKFIAPLAIALTLATPLHALDLTEWGTAGNWAILQDPNHGNDCLAQASLSDGSLIRMGFRDNGKKGFLSTFNPAWKEFKLDHKYPVTYLLDADTFEGEAHGVQANNMPGAQVRFESIDFLVDLAVKNTMTFLSKGVEVVKIDLKGSEDALKQVIVCQAELG